MESFEQFAMMLESNPMLLLAISIWEALWTLIALWFSGRNNHKGWFITCGLLELFGIVEIIYLATKTSFFKDFKFNA